MLSTPVVTLTVLTPVSIPTKTFLAPVVIPPPDDCPKQVLLEPVVQASPEI